MGQKVLIEKLVAAGLPANVQSGALRALAGLDHWKSAAGMICIGRPPRARLSWRQLPASSLVGRPL